MLLVLGDVHQVFGRGKEILIKLLFTITLLLTITFKLKKKKIVNSNNMIVNSNLLFGILIITRNNLHIKIWEVH